VGGFDYSEGDYGRAVNITRIKRKLETISAGTAKTECGRKRTNSRKRRATRATKTSFTRLGNKKKGQMLSVVDVREKSHVVYQPSDLKYDSL